MLSRPHAERTSFDKVLHGWCPKLVLLFVVMFGLVIGAPPAQADVSQMTSDLCSSYKIPCGIQFRNPAREGGTAIISVTGLPGLHVQVQLFRLEIVGQTVTGMTALNDPVGVAIDSSGYGATGIPILPFSAGNGGGGWVLATLADTTWSNPDQIVGDIKPLLAREATILGDGFGDQKPVGQPIDLMLTNYLSGSIYTVDYFGDDSNWHNITRTTSVDNSAGQDVMTLTYQIPSGLYAVPYRFRLHNVTDPRFLDQEWTAIPSKTALELARIPVFQPPELGEAVAAVNITPNHPRLQFQIGYLTAAVLVGIVALSIPVFAIRRTRIEGHQ